MRTHLARWGNSLALRIPRRLADEAGLAEGRDFGAVFRGFAAAVPAMRSPPAFFVTFPDRLDVLPAMLHSRTPN